MEQNNSQKLSGYIFNKTYHKDNQRNLTSRLFCWLIGARQQRAKHIFPPSDYILDFYDSFYQGYSWGCTWKSKNRKNRKIAVTIFYLFITFFSKVKFDQISIYLHTIYQKCINNLYPNLNRA